MKHHSEHHGHHAHGGHAHHMVKKHSMHTMKRAAHKKGGKVESPMHGEVDEDPSPKEVYAAADPAAHDRQDYTHRIAVADTLQHLTAGTIGISLILSDWLTLRPDHHLIGRAGSTSRHAHRRPGAGVYPVHGLTGRAGHIVVDAHWLSVVITRLHLPGRTGLVKAVDCGPLRQARGVGCVWIVCVRVDSDRHRQIARQCQK